MSELMMYRDNNVLWWVSICHWGRVYVCVSYNRKCLVNIWNEWDVFCCLVDSLYHCTMQSTHKWADCVCTALTKGLWVNSLIWLSCIINKPTRNPARPGVNNAVLICTKREKASRVWVIPCLSVALCASLCALPQSFPDGWCSMSNWLTFLPPCVPHYKTCKGNQDHFPAKKADGVSSSSDTPQLPRW